MFSYILGNPI
jgi:hypothetical protein